VAQRLHATPSWAPLRDVQRSTQSVGVERRRQLGDEWQRQRPFREQPAGARSQVVQCGQALAAEYLAYLERRGRWLLWAS